MQESLIDSRAHGNAARRMLFSVRSVCVVDLLAVAAIFAVSVLLGVAAAAGFLALVFHAMTRSAPLPTGVSATPVMRSIALADELAA